MTIDGFIKLSDAETRAATARANIANTMADVATKIAQIGLIKEETIKKRLENIAKALDIKWDKQAHDHLLKTRNMALQEARKLEEEADKTKRFTERLSRLLAGDGTWTNIRDAWVAFEFFRGRVPAAAAIKMGSIVVESQAYQATSWKHPEKKPVSDVPQEDQDLGGMLGWARKNTLYPKTGSAAWQALAAYLEAMSEAATERASQIRTEADEAEKEALELSKLDWDRLKEKNN